MPLEANLFYGASSPSPSSKRRLQTKSTQSTTPTASASTSSASIPSLHSSYTPSPNHTSRIPAPSPATSSSSASNSTITRHKRPSTTTTNRRKRSSVGVASSSSSPSSSSSSSRTTTGSFKLHFQGRVYRPFAHTSPPNARRLYSPANQLLGQPDEMVNDSEAIIDCICKDNEDDSTLMIQCDDCDVWVHARCVGFETEDDCPEDYRCKKCAPAFAISMATKQPAKLVVNDTQKTREREHTPPSLTDNNDYSIKRLANASSLSASPTISSEEQKTSDSEDGGLEVEQPSPLTATGGLNSSPLSRTPTRKAAINHRSSNSLHSHNSLSPSQYSVSRNLLSEFAGASPSIKAGPLHPLLTATKKRKFDSEQNQDDTQEITREDSDLPSISSAHKCSGKPSGRSYGSDLTSTAAPPPLDPSTVPLPDHYTSLLNLHSALERALLLHLATEGSKACSAVTSSSSSSTSLINNADGGATTALHAQERIVVELPNLATFTGIRAVVERGANKRFGPTELAQLVWLWEGGLSGPLASEDSKTYKTRGGLSMSVSASRELDRISGKKVYTWGIGIRLELKENAPLPALEVVDPTPASRTSPASPFISSPSSTSSSPSKIKRYGLSVLPLWSSKGEYRKQEMRRRLGECVLKAHDDFSSGIPVSMGAKDMDSAGAHDRYMLPTPPPSTRKPGNNSNSVVSNSSKHGFAKGFILDALPPIPAASLPALGPASTSSLSVPTLSAQPHKGIANADMLDVIKAEKVAQQPSTRDLSTHKLAKIDEEAKRNSLLEGMKATAPKAPAEQRAMSLLDRIKAKEAAALAAKQSGDASAEVNTGSSASRGSSKDPRNMARMSLEAASARAAKRKTAATVSRNPYA